MSVVDHERCGAEHAIEVGLRVESKGQMPSSSKGAADVKPTN